MQATLESEKLAQTEYPILDLLARRWSPLAFSSRPVEPDKLRSVLEAARWAPSSYNASLGASSSLLAKIRRSSTGCSVPW